MNLKRIDKIIVTVCLSAFALLILSMVIENIARTIERNKVSSHSEFVKIQDHKLHYRKKGSGNCTVVFESGIDLGGHLSWLPIQDSIANYATTISYDRAGILLSERGQAPKSAKNIALDLTQLLEATKCPKPYIMVGHSFGGLPLMEFINKNRERVAGVVFIDVSHPNQFEISRKLAPAKKVKNNDWLIHLYYQTGLHRLSKLYPQLTGSCKGNACKITYESLAASLEEKQNLETICNEVKAIKDFGKIDLKVISADPGFIYRNVKDSTFQNKLIDARMGLQKDLCKLSVNAEFILAKHAGHYVHHEQPQLVSKIIQEMALKHKD